MADQVLIRGVAVGGVQPMQAATGRNYWTVTDDQGQDWKVWDAQTAMQANGLQGQMTAMTVRIAPSKNPEFGMNYTLKAIAPAPAGAQPSPPIPLAQGQPQPIPMQGMQPIPQQMPTAQAVPQQMPEVLRPPVKTLGQGGTYTDADITRMARSTAIDAVVNVAFHYEDFRDDDTGEVSWEAIYAAAEAVTKFVLFRKHEGWEPGKEITPTANEQNVMAEVNAQFGEGTIQQGLPELQPQAQAQDADGGDVGWGE